MNSVTNNESSRKLIAFYGRVSTSLQEDQKTILNQEMELDALAVELYGTGNYIVVRKYYDEGWSGDILARPHLDQLRQDADANMWDAVLIYDPDRLARRYSYQELVLDELEAAGKQVLFRTVPPPKDPEEKLMRGFRGLFAQYERMRIAERFRIGKLRKARDKHIITSIAPYGYTLVTRQGKPRDANFVETHLIINPVEARVVRMLFDLVGNQGLTLRKVIRRLQEQGIKPRKNKEGVWGTTTLSTMLKRETYIGQAYFGASIAVEPKKPWKKDEKYRRVKKTSRKMKPKDEWLPIPVQPILEGEEGKALFDRTQRQLTKNYEESLRNKKNSYLLAERIRCDCGCSRTGEGPQHGKYLYYRCSNRVKSFPLPPTCHEKGINSRIADERVWLKLVELLNSKDLIEHHIRQWTERQRNKSGATRVGVDALKQEVSTLKKQEQRYQLAYGGGAIELAQLTELTVPLKTKIGELEKQIVNERAAAQGQNDNSILRPEEVELLNTDATESLKGLSFEQKRDIVLDVVDGIVGVPGRLRVSGFVPVAIVSPIQRDFIFPSSTNIYVELKTSDRHCWFTERREIDAI